MKKELYEIKRQMRIENCGISKITVYIVDSERNCRLEFKKTFLNLPEEEQFKYFDIFRSVLSGKPGRKMFQLDFKCKERAAHLLDIVASGLQDDEIRQIFLEEIADFVGVSNKTYTLILIASGVYDVPKIAKDGADLDESEEVYRYMIGCLCPVNLSQAGLSYKPDLADVQERTRDWVVSVPTQGFLYPAFTDRSSDPEHVWYYSKHPNNPDEGLISEVLKCHLPQTPIKQQEVFRESLNAVNRKVSLEQAKDIYHSLGDIQEIKMDMTDKRLKASEMENLLRGIGIDPDTAAESTKEYDKAEIDPENIVNTKRFEIGLSDAHITVAADRTDLVTTRMIDGEKYILIKADGDICANGIFLENPEGKKDEEEE